ncbi:MAG: alkaline phosphatase family protein, partial [Planctomycetota bacterium]
VLNQFTNMSKDEIEALMNASQEQRLRKMIEYRLVYPFVRDDRFHRIFLALLESEPWRFATVYYRLIDFVCHGFWTAGHELPEDFERRFGNIVDRAYVWIDDCLGQVWDRLDKGDRLMVVSDHGFTTHCKTSSVDSEDLSEISYGQHAEPAVLLIYSGSRTGKIEDVTLLDIAPTILDYLGIEQAHSLDGGPIPALLHAESPRKLKAVDAYPYTPPTETSKLTDQEQEAVMKRLAALGYLE